MKTIPHKKSLGGTMRERPSYYAVIPANVRYDKNLSANAKLLYGEITALCNKAGHCWAGNRYFADLYGTVPRTVRRWIGELETGGYITIEYKYVSGTNEIETRFIRISEAGGDKNVTTSEGELAEPEGERSGKAEEDAVIRQERPPEPETGTDGGGDKNVTTSGEKCPEVGSKMSEGGDKNMTHNITSNSTNNTSSSPEISKSEKKDEEVKNKFKNRDMRKLFSEIDKSLIFDGFFYMDAEQFLEKYQLPDDYLSWLYKLCKDQNPRNLKNYYYKLFTSEQMLELYRQQKKPGISKPTYGICPVCGEKIDVSEQRCPYCRFETKDRNDNTKTSAAKEERRRRTAEISRLREKETDTKQLIKAIAEMEKRNSA
jgi:hypothetical protein